MALVIQTHQNNNKKHINFFGEGLDLSIYSGVWPVLLLLLLLLLFYSLKKLFEEMVRLWMYGFQPIKISLGLRAIYEVSSREPWLSMLGSIKNFRSSSRAPNWGQLCNCNSKLLLLACVMTTHGLTQK